MVHPTEHKFKDRLYEDNFFQYESKKNSAELSDFVWGREKEKVNVDLDLSILDKTKPYSPVSKKMHVMPNRELSHPLCKESVE